MSKKELKTTSYYQSIRSLIYIFALIAHGFHFLSFLISFLVSYLVLMLIFYAISSLKGGNTIQKINKRTWNMPHPTNYMPHPTNYTRIVCILASKEKDKAYNVLRGVAKTIAREAHGYRCEWERRDGVAEKGAHTILFLWVNSRLLESTLICLI